MLRPAVFSNITGCQQSSSDFNLGLSCARQAMTTLPQAALWAFSMPLWLWGTDRRAVVFGLVPYLFECSNVVARDVCLLSGWVGGGQPAVVSLALVFAAAAVRVHSHASHWELTISILVSLLLLGAWFGLCLVRCLDLGPTPDIEPASIASPCSFGVQTAGTGFAVHSLGRTTRFTHEDIHVQPSHWRLDRIPKDQIRSLHHDLESPVDDQLRSPPEESLPATNDGVSPSLTTSF